MPLPMLKDDYFASMHWDRETGHVSAARAEELGMSELLVGFTASAAPAAGAEPK